jgi:hypothetical protein
LFPCSIVGLFGIVLGLGDSLFMCAFRETFGFPLDVFYNTGVSSERRVVRPYDGLDDLIHSLLTLRVNPCYYLLFKFADLNVEDGGACHVDQLIGIFEFCFPVVIGDCEVVDLETLKTLIPFGGVEGGRVVEILVE